MATKWPVVEHIQAVSDNAVEFNMVGPAYQPGHIFCLQYIAAEALTQQKPVVRFGFIRYDMPIWLVSISLAVSQFIYACLPVVYVPSEYRVIATFTGTDVADVIDVYYWGYLSPVKE
jgi:hypothetical protein